MKIKTITCHDVYNYGASLQAFALATYISRLGHEIEIIDYKPDYLRHYKLFGLDNRKYDKPILREVYNIAKFPGRFVSLFSRRKKAFDDFTRNYLNTTKRNYSSNDNIKEDIPQADIYIAGSDQIWNPLFKNGKDPAFFLDFVPKDKVKASYAASFSTNRISEDDSNRMRNWLKDFDAISVRESSGIEILDSMGINDARVVLDPVFLLSKSDWKTVCKEFHIVDKYILVYDFDLNEKLGKVVKEYASKKRLKIYSIFKNKFADKVLMNTGPLEFISLIKNAEFVVSNSFHATAFSLIFEKQFIVVKREENINARMEDLLSAFDIPERIIEIDEGINETEINYKKVGIKMSDLINESKEYINIILKQTNDR